MALEDIGCRAVVEGLSQFKSSFDQMNQKTQEYVNKTSEGMAKAQASIDKFAQSIGTSSTRIGVALAAAGAAITGVMALSVKAIVAEQAGITNLATALKAVGVEYDEVKESLEELIAVQQAKTAFADDQQREAFSELISITGDYNASLRLLPLAMDLARGKNMDLVSASMLLGRVQTGNMELLARYGIQVREGANATEALAMIQERYGGRAEAYGKQVAGALDNIKNNVGDLSETIGTHLEPVIGAAAKTVNTIIVGLKDWMEVHPMLSKAVVFTTSALGLQLAAMGTLILTLPVLTTLNASLGAVMNGTAFATARTTASLLAHATAHTIAATATKAATAAMWAFNAAMNANPIGVVVMGVGLLAAAFLGLQNQAAESSRKTREELDKLAEAARKAREANYGLLTMGPPGMSEAEKKASAEFIKAVEAIRKKYEDVIAAWKYAQTDAGKLGLTMEDLTYYLLKHGMAVADIENAYAKFGEDVNKVARGLGLDLREIAADIELTTDKMVSNIEEYTSNLKKTEQDIVDTRKDSLDKQLRAESEAHQTRLDNLDKEYRQTIRTIDDTLNARLEAYNADIAAIDEELRAIESAEKAKLDARKKADLEAAIATEYDLKRKADLNAELNDLILQSDDKKWQEQRKLELQDMIEAESDAEVRAYMEAELQDYLDKLDALTKKQELENQRKTLQEKIAEAQKYAESERQNARDTYEYKLELENQAYNSFTKDIQARKEALDAELKETLARYDDDLEAFKRASADKLRDTEAFVQLYNTMLDQLKNKTVTVTTVYRTVSGGSPASYDPGIYPLAEGGKVRARPGGTLGILAEAGEDEYVIPQSKVFSFIGNMLSRLATPSGVFSRSYASPSVRMAPMGGGILNSHNRTINYNVNASYSRSQSPVSLRHDLEAIAMMARG